ncbi:serine/threonine-protein kinase [Streptomyces sp. N35]|uniref:serine/threonine-protein kinase n=1 Tax=Streptomyces sp. N35 TaxID=2795730 RepID=UPI0018F4A674|nr:serine/threonine-protein kinase [Streptomyces sp. N35]
MGAGTLFAGRYVLVDELGQGAFGLVYRAWDIREQRYVAAKMLQQSQAHNLLRFVREGARRIEHPHVLAPSGWAAADDKVLIAMDLAGGGTLASLVGDYGPLPPRYVATLVDQLLAGLEAVHGMRIVHRDIKPGNLLLEATGQKQTLLRIADFGLAHQDGDVRMTQVHQVIGTPGYIAPEQYDGAEPDPQADLFAVGVVALYLLQGQHPDTPALVRAYTDDGTPPAAPEQVPEPWWQVISQLLHPDPLQRLATAHQAREALTAIAPQLPEPDSDSIIEVFDQLAPLPDGFGRQGPLTTEPQPAAEPDFFTGVTAQLRRPQAAAADAALSQPASAPAPAPSSTATTARLTAPVAPAVDFQPAARESGLPTGTGWLTGIGFLLIAVGIWAWLQA